MNMGAISQLCTAALLLEAGAIACQGSVADVVSSYMGFVNDQLGLTQDLRTWRHRTGTGLVRIVRASLSWEGQGQGLSCMFMGDTLIIRFEVERDSSVQTSDLRFSAVISTITGIRVYHVTSTDDAFTMPDTRTAEIGVRLPGITLYPGTYTVTLWVGAGATDHDYVHDCLSFEVVQSDALQRVFKMNWSHGLVLHPSSWSVGESDGDI